MLIFFHTIDTNLNFSTKKWLDSLKPSLYVIFAQISYCFFSVFNTVYKTAAKAAPNSGPTINIHT